jgi:hypothetical protein
MQYTPLHARLTALLGADFYFYFPLALFTFDIYSPTLCLANICGKAFATMGTCVPFFLQQKNTSLVFRYQKSTPKGAFI